MSTRTRRRLKLGVLITALLAFAFASGNNGLTIYAQGGGKQPPSKVAAIILDRVAKLAAARTPAGALPAAATSALSSQTLVVSPDGQLEVEFHADGPVGATHSATLAGFGATILASTGDIQWPAGVTPPPQLGIITVRMPAAAIEAAANLPWVVAVTPAERLSPDVGSVTSEGVKLHKTDLANTLGFTGTGVSVGVVSDGVSNIAAAQALGDLPAAVNVLNAGSGDEGTAMLEIIHDLAPNAALSFHGTGGGVGSHITALNNLAGAGAQVIAEDIPFDSEPAFQKGAAATAAENLAVAGVSVHSSAGNLGSTHSARVAANGTAQGPDGNSPPFAGCPYNPVNTVAIAPAGDTTFDVSVGAGATLGAVLQWSEPRAIFPTPGRGGFTDLDLFVFNAAGTSCLASSIGTQANGVGDTIEQVSWTNGGGSAVTVKLVVNVFGTSSAVAAPTLDLRWRGASATDTPTRAGSLNPDSNYTFGATSAAAADASSSTDPNTIAIESFSAGGPVQLFSTTICPNGAAGPCTGTAGAAGQTAGAPTWTAADGVSVSGAGGFGSGNCPSISPGDCRFFGTSAAAPHAAGVAALVRQSLGGGATPLTIAQRMAATAKDRGAPGFDNVWGFGVLNALAAVGEEADLAVSKDCLPDGLVDAGQTVTCTIFVDNNGPSLARNVQLTDTLTGSGAFAIGAVTTSQGSCSTAANVVTCALGDLAAAAPGTSGRATVSVNFSATQAVSVNDVASAVSSTFDPDLDNNEASDAVTIRSVADLRITKSAPASIIAGNPLTYTLAINNDGPSPAPGVIVDDFLPAGVTIVSATGTGGATCNAGVPGDSSRPTECTFGTLSSGASRGMTIMVTVDPGTTGSLTNDASILSSVSDPDTSDNFATALTTVATSADLVIQKTDTPDPVLAGRLLTYALKVFNNGPSSAVGVVVEDPLPDQVDFSSATFSNGTGTCVLLDVNPAPPTKKVSCQLGKMAPNASSPVFIYINTTVKSGTADGTVLNNTATVSSSTPDPAAGNNTAAAQTTVLNRADLAIVKTSDADVYKPSATIMYTIAVTQNGPSDALNVVVTDVLPAIKAAVYVFDTGGCAHVGDTLTCSLGTIASGATKAFNVYVTVKGSKGSITNTATVSSATFDPNAANNTSTRVVLVGK